MGKIWEDDKGRRTKERRCERSGKEEKERDGRGTEYVDVKKWRGGVGGEEDER